ncbi:hypothetical protein [Sphingobium sp. AntQ-1]|uniref:hypothetical protein n=1 Tax=Sphingobium sp. AntQ-1 TaxID=2930091 RepID=UPI00234F39D6|nr:hypothetical protein [Sphingobium sp. AntQ-1]
MIFNIQMARGLKTLLPLFAICASACVHTDSSVPIYRCNAMKIRSGDEIVSAIKVTSTVHGDIGSFEHCNGFFGIGFGNYLLSPKFEELRLFLARQANGEAIEITVTGLMKFELRDDAKYPGSANFISVDNWQLKKIENP